MSNYLLLVVLIVRSREESQDDIVLRSDWTTCRRSRIHRMGKKNVVCIKSDSNRRRQRKPIDKILLLLVQRINILKRAKNGALHAVH